MKAYKKIAALIIALFTLICFAACSDDAPSGDNSGTGNTDQNTATLCAECGVGEYEVTVTPAGILTDGEALYSCTECSYCYTEAIAAKKSAKVLFVGDNSTLGEIEYLDEILGAVGVRDITVATLNCDHAKGASIDAQWANIGSSKTKYTLTKLVNGEKSYAYSQTFDAGIGSENWDAIVIGQALTLSGDSASYVNLSSYVSYINEKCQGAKLLWNMSWALSDSSTHADFSKYENSRAKMYSDIISATVALISENEMIDGIVPVGTAIENLRSTALGDSWTDSGILLGGASGDGGKYAASLLFAKEILSLDISELGFSPDAGSNREQSIYKMAKEAAELASLENFEINTPECKTMKLLMMGNSYGNDAMAYFEKILNEAGYINVVIGHMGESSMAINDHYHNIDDDPTNDYIYKSTGNTFSVHYKTVNGVRVELEADYKKIVADEDWDIITFYQGPNSMDTLVKESYYSELNNLLAAIKENMTNPDGKIIYYMPWVHGSTDTPGFYAQLSALTEKLFADNKLCDGIIPAGTVIENLRTSYLSSATDGTGDINRDWGHLNYGVGRYAIALTFYAYLTGGDISDIKYIPTREETQLPFTDPAPNLDVIREAVNAALDDPFKVTESVYKEKP